MSSGLKDGQLVLHDMRSHQVISKTRIHGGAVNLLDTTLSGFIVTGSADKTIKTFDIMQGCKPI